MSKELGWKKLPMGGIIEEAGNASSYETGTWRSFRPVFHPEICIHCLFCWIYCPDGAIIVEDSKVKGINFFHCKGCGICSRECPTKVKSITMEQEV